MTDEAKKGYLIKFKVDGTEYLIDELDLGDAEMLQEFYGRDDLTNFNLKEPKLLAGLIHVALKHANPDMGFDDIREKVKAVNPIKFEKPEGDDDEDESATDPTGVVPVGDDEPSSGTGTSGG